MCPTPPSSPKRTARLRGATLFLGIFSLTAEMIIVGVYMGRSGYELGAHIDLFHDMDNILTAAGGIDCQMILSAVLVAAAYNKHLPLLSVYIVLQFFLYLLSICNAVGRLIGGWERTDFQALISLSTFCIAGFAFWLLCWWTVVRYYQELARTYKREDAEEEKIEEV